MVKGQKKILKRLLEIHEQLAENKPLYKEMDEIVKQLMEHKFVSGKIGDKVFVMVDNFAEKNTVYRATGIKRFEIKIEEAP